MEKAFVVQKVTQRLFAHKGMRRLRADKEDKRAIIF